MRGESGGGGRRSRNTFVSIERAEIRLLVVSTSTRTHHWLRNDQQNQASMHILYIIVFGKICIWSR